jgi:pimeloyl-ACP methyl ester carboxylesterase
MDYADLAGDVVELLDRLKIERATAIGHSMGGKTAMLLACRHPGRVSRLIVVDIAPKNYRWVGHRHEFAAMNDLDLANLQSRAEAEMRMESRVPDWGLRKFLTTNLERTDTGWRWIVNLPAVTAALPFLEKNPLGPADRYAGPTLFIVGGKSNYVQPQADLPDILAHFPQARLTVMANSGHNPHFDAREDFVRTVLPGPGSSRTRLPPSPPASCPLP